MKLYFEGTYSARPEMLLQRCGYGRARSRVPSYQRRLRGTLFPRFHAYIDTNQQSGFRINLHLDQKAACYGGSTAHSGEYDGPLVEQEAKRIKLYVQQMKIAE